MNGSRLLGALTKIVLAGLMTLLIASCVKNPTVVSDYCAIARPFFPEDTDARSTKRSSARELAKFSKLCPDRAKELGIYVEVGGQNGE